MIFQLSHRNYFKLKLGNGLGTNTIAYLNALWGLLLFTSQQGLQRLQIVRDSKMIVNWYNQNSQLNIQILEPWHEIIRQLQEHFEDISVFHEYREFNQPTDLLSKEALEVEDVRYNLL